MRPPVAKALLCGISGHDTIYLTIALLLCCLPCSKVTGVLKSRCETPLPPRPSQGDLLANAHRSSSRPVRPDDVLDLSAPPRVAMSASAGALFPPSAPAGVQLALGGTPHLR